MTPDAPFPIAIGGDHAGLPLKQALQQALAAAGHGLLDFGTNEAASVDYPDFAHRVCAAVEDGRARFGVLVCGSGIGMAMAANRHGGIRAAVLHDATEARLTRAHNDANVAAFGARLVGPEVALDALRAFLSTPYEGGRHDRRLAKLSLPSPTPEPSPASSPGT
jgi:ribose 5-phosphate isomerase B